MTATARRTVRISPADAAQRASLIGLAVRVRGLFDYPAGVTGTVERIDGMRAVVRFPDGRWCYAGRVLTLA